MLVNLIELAANCSCTVCECNLGLEWRGHIVQLCETSSVMMENEIIQKHR